MDTGSMLCIAGAAAVLLLAFYFSLAEAAFENVSRSRIKSMEDSERRVNRALRVLDRRADARCAILTGTVLSHVTLAALVAYLVTLKWPGWAAAVGAVCAAFAVFLLAEALPKRMGEKYPERVSLACGGLMCFFMVLFKPVYALFNAIGRGFASLTKGDPEVSVTEDELYDIIEDMTDTGSLDTERGELVSSALQFADLTADNILTARVDVSAIDVEWDAAQVLDFIKRERHSRLPVYEDSIDHIIGVLQIRKYIREYIVSSGRVDLRSLLDEAYFVDRDMKIDKLLSLMSAKKLNMAVVTDGYGGTLGIVTVEDILEELVGEIWDEDDVVEESFVPLGGGRFEVDAEMPVGETWEKLGLDLKDLPDDWEYKLMGEWAYEQFDRIPSTRESFVYGRLSVTVSEMKLNRIVKLVCRVLPEPGPDSGEGGAEK